VTGRQLITNCHVVEGQALIFAKQGETIEPVHLVARDVDTDRCVLGATNTPLVPVKGFLNYSNLQVGEEVFTVGSPSGLEATLGQGIISGLRSIDRQRLIQTTAHISPGSSGGGLFDRSGNLIGITTFLLREAQGLNFAIAAEDYFR
jgi:S1-C subfamily serine protease